jgi:hypothetical protein
LRSEHKLTIGTNRPAPALVALFEDLLAHSPAAASISRATAASVLSFQLHSGAVSGPRRHLQLLPSHACSALCRQHAATHLTNRTESGSLHSA